LDTGRRGSAAVHPQGIPKNSSAGRLLLILLTEDSVRRAALSDLTQPRNIRDLLKRLEVEPFDKHYVIEAIDCPKPFEEVLGV